MSGNYSGDVLTSPRATALSEEDRMVLFENSREVRPAAARMGELVVRGVTEEAIIQAGEKSGYERPIIPETLAELNTSLFGNVNTGNGRYLPGQTLGIRRP